MDKTGTKNMTGTVLEIQRMSTEDGPGIRTTVFMKGCTLKCRWCHNPESISPLPQLNWLADRCMMCGICVSTCPHGVLGKNNKSIIIDREKCKGCGTCAGECPTTALELLGRKWTVEELATELVKDKSFFMQSGGGVTVSGGEPLMQYGFITELLKTLKDHGISTAVDTCGMVRWEAIESILPYADLILFDLKEIDPVLHRQFTGNSNEQILSNFTKLTGYAGGTHSPVRIWVRTPVIPWMTDSPANIEGIGNFIARNAPDTVERWELCAFNNLCRDKYIRLGREWCLGKEPLLKRETMELLRDAAVNSGARREIVLWSGPVRLETEEHTAADELPAVN